MSASAERCRAQGLTQARSEQAREGTGQIDTSQPGTGQTFQRGTARSS